MRPFTHISSPGSNFSLKALVDTGCQQTVNSTTICSESGERPRGPRQVVTRWNGEKTECGEKHLGVDGVLVRKHCLVEPMLVCGDEIILG